MSRLSNASKSCIVSHLRLFLIRGSAAVYDGMEARKGGPSLPAIRTWRAAGRFDIHGVRQAAKLLRQRSIDQRLLEITNRK